MKGGREDGLILKTQELWWHGQVKSQTKYF